MTAEADLSSGVILLLRHAVYDAEMQVFWLNHKLRFCGSLSSRGRSSATDRPGVLLLRI